MKRKPDMKKVMRVYRAAMRWYFPVRKAVVASNAMFADDARWWESGELGLYKACAALAKPKRRGR